MSTLQISEHDKKMIFWASFLSLLAAGVGFAFRVMVLGDWQDEFELTGAEVGSIFGYSLWPIAVTMILFSLIVDKIGPKISMYFAFVLQAASGVLTFLADSPIDLYVAAACAGLGHGVVEAVINPVCASIYTHEKSKMLNILHAAWPAGLVVGGALMLTPGLSELSWQVQGLWIIVPTVIYGIMFIKPKFPIDERVRAKVPYADMLKEVGFLGAFIASFLLFYEIYGKIGAINTDLALEPAKLLWISVGFGVVVGAAFGAFTKSIGKPLFFILCVLMIPLATTELGTDAWIKELMTPTMGDLAGWAIVASAFIMMILRFQAGQLTKRFSPPTILVISSCFSFAGLMMLSVSAGLVVWLAFVLYAVGQTFYWPTVLGFTAERYPRGGALTLNTVSAIGLLSVGIIGAPILGAFSDNHTVNNVKEISETVYEASKTEQSFFGATYDSIDRTAASEAAEAAGLADEYNEAINNASRQSLRTTAISFPLVMGICFALIALWFRARGGYKPILLEDAAASEGKDAEASEPGF
ncbi:MAG: MFS transporter [Planctomycetota bacterium]